MGKELPTQTDHETPDLVDWILDAIDSVRLDDPSDCIRTLQLRNGLAVKIMYAGRWCECDVVMVACAENEKMQRYLLGIEADKPAVRSDVTAAVEEALTWYKMLIRRMLMRHLNG